MRYEIKSLILVEATELRKLSDDKDYWLKEIIKTSENIKLIVVVEYTNQYITIYCKNQMKIVFATHTVQFIGKS